MIQTTNAILLCIVYGSLSIVLVSILSYLEFREKYLEKNFEYPIIERFFRRIWREPILLFKKLKRSISWFIFMWDNYDFDECYLLQVMNRKIEDMIRFYKSSYVWQEDKSKKEIIKDLFLARRYLKMMINNDFIKRDWDNYYKKWGHSELVTKPCEDKPGYTEWVGFKYENADTPEKKIECDSEFKVLHKKEQKTAIEVQEKLFKLLNDKINYWWD